MNLSKQLIEMHEDFNIHRELKTIKSNMNATNVSYEELLIYKANLEIWIIKNIKYKSLVVPVLNIISKKLNSSNKN